MDSNFSRLYYMLNNNHNNNGSDPVMDTLSSTNVNEPIINSIESRNLLINHNNNDLTILPTNESFSTTATLEVSSTTIINNNNNRLNTVPDVPETTRRRKSRNESSTNEIQMEYHFNPLYIISDNNNQSNSNDQAAIDDRNNSSTNCYIPHCLYDHISSATLISPPSDRYHLIYIALLLAGIGFLLPYNSFMIAVDYFQQRFPNSTIVFDMSTTYIIFAFITVIIQNIFFVESVPLYRRLRFGYGLSLFFMVIVVIYEIWARMGTYFDNLFMISIISIGCTIQQSTFYGYTSMLPKKYVQAVMTGESAAGIFVSLNRIITKILYPQDTEYNTVLFFLISIIVIMFCAIVHLIMLPRSHFIRYHMFMCNHQSNSDGAQIIHQINENVGLVNMYHNKESANHNQRNNQQSDNNQNNSFQNIQQQNLINQNFVETSKYYHSRPSIFSTESINVDNNDQLMTNSTVHRNLNVKVQNMLRTDSNELVLPFGIDDEEIIVETGQQSRPLTDESFDLNNNNNEINNDHYSVSFKSTSTNTTLLVRWLHHLEINTRFFYHLRRSFRRLRKCDEQISQFLRMLHKKYFIRKSIVYRIWPYIMSIMLVYFVTLTIFPGIESEIYSCRYGDWFPIVLMATFNLTDFIGKLMSALFYRINRMQLLTLSCLRFLLIPLFALSIAPRPHPFFANPIMPVIFSIILGLTNGIFGSLPMILAPFKVNEQMREITGNLMTFSYIIGLTSGSFASYVLNDWTSTSTNTTNTNMYQLYCVTNQTTITTNITTIITPNITPNITSINIPQTVNDLGPNLTTNLTLKPPITSTLASTLTIP